MTDPTPRSRDQTGMVVVAGYGIRGVRQLTLETMVQLRAADTVFFFPGPGLDEEWLLGPGGASSCESLAHFYREGSIDRDVYQAVVDHILGKVRTGAQTVLLMPGHPRLGVTIVSLLESECKRESIPLQGLDGVSSFDTMISDLARDPLNHGTVLLDANRLLADPDAPLYPGHDYFIYHICSVGNARIQRANPELDNRLDLIQRRLGTVFPPDHAVVLLRSGTVERHQLELTIPLSELVDVAAKIDYATTLVIPAAVVESA